MTREHIEGWLFVLIQTIFIGAFAIVGVLLAGLALATFGIIDPPNLCRTITVVTQ